MKRVNITGEKFFHVFRRVNGKLFEEETDEMTYRAQGSRGGSSFNPKSSKGKKWEYSYSRWKVDTPSGDVGQDEYIDEGKSITFVDNNGFLTSLPKQECFNEATESINDIAILDKPRHPDDFPKKEEWAKK